MNDKSDDTTSIRIKSTDQERFKVYCALTRRNMQAGFSVLVDLGLAAENMEIQRTGELMPERAEDTDCAS